MKKYLKILKYIGITFGGLIGLAYITFINTPTGIMFFENIIQKIVG